MSNRDADVILACLKLSRAMRRCPPDPAEHPFPPAVGRLMECIAANPGVSSRDLCEMLDLRPSSLSEMLARAESDGLAVRTVNEEDRRLQRVNLSEKGRALVTRMQEAREADIAKKTACFTDEEKAQFYIDYDYPTAMAETMLPYIESSLASIDKHYEVYISAE